MTGTRHGARRHARKATIVTAALCGAMLAACGGDPPSAIDPRGLGAQRIEGLWWLVFWIAAVVFAVVCVFLVVAVLRGQRDDVEPAGQVRWGEPFIVVSGVLLPTVILVGVFAVALSDMQESARTDERASLEIEVTSHDWWWEARYPNGAVTANEIHIPVGQPVRLRLTSADVIHSFWVPQLQGKADHVTGRSRVMWLQADEPGRYRGQCAEFCGLQHAHMAFYVVAQGASDFRAWLEAIARPATATASPEGRRVFLSSTCVGCHTIQGTSAVARVGPDLTHLGSRETLFAGTVPNDAVNLRKVILAPQSLKPGVAMPPTDLSPKEVDALVTYLQELE
jgi:cytochrome c oxidase subunit 2